MISKFSEPFVSLGGAVTSPVYVAVLLRLLIDRGRDKSMEKSTY